MPGGKINQLLKLWKASFGTVKGAPFENRNHLYAMIDAIPYGLDWESFTVSYPPSNNPEEVRPPWMDQEFEVWHRDVFDVVKSIISNPDFDGEFDYSPYQHYVDGSHQFRDFMSGNWSWRQAVSKINTYNLYIANNSLDSNCNRKPRDGRFHVCTNYSR